MSILITSDIHLTDKPRDEYRWGLFPWLQEQINLHEIDSLFILGDITQDKAGHSATLVNRVADSFSSLRVNNLWILRGNHDYLGDESLPFFKFLSHINGQFITEPIYIPNLQTYLIPNMPNFDEVVIPDDIQLRYIMTHQTYTGAIAETDRKLTGVSAHCFDYLVEKFPDLVIISGDIHVPQMLNDGRIIYVGAPYPIRFNDKFEPRVLLIDGHDDFHDLHFESLRRHTLEISKIEDLHNARTKPGDQVKIRLHLDDFTNWDDSLKEITEYCRLRDLDLHKVEPVRTTTSLPIKDQRFKAFSPSETLNKFCEKSQITKDTTQYGLDILNSQI